MNIYGMNFLLLSIIVIILSCPISSNSELSKEQINSPQLQKALELLNSGKHSEAVKSLSDIKPGPESLAQYHFIYAKALISANRLNDVLEHLRSAYLYSPKGGMKELLLLERAEVYLKMKYFDEAKNIYLIFLKKYPESEHIRKAYTGFARCSFMTGAFRDAIAYYEKAGNLPDAMFGRANTFQRTGMIKEASDAYDKALKNDSAFISRSEETRYYYAENLRMTGRSKDAEKNLSSIKDPLLKNRAEVSLGLIAMEEGSTDQAKKHFSAALSSTDRTVRRLALLRLAGAETKAGRVNESKTMLEEIRYKYPYGKDYDSAVLMLSGIYMGEGRHADAVRILKELVFRSSPQKEALDEFEKIILSAREKDPAQFLDLWKSVGVWLLDSSREKFLLDISETLKGNSRLFLKVTQYLSKHGSVQAKTGSLAMLATYYAETGDTASAGEYLRKLRAMKVNDDELARIESRIAYAGKDLRTASEKILKIKKLQKDDIVFLGKALGSVSNNKQALAKYEKALKETDADAGLYIRLADIYYDTGRKKEALEHYRLALKKDPANEWGLYRTSLLSDSAGTEDMLRKTAKGRSSLDNMSNALLKEIEINKKLTEIF